MLISKSKFSKTTKLHELVGSVQFVVFEKSTTAYYTKLHKKSCYLLVIYMKKASQKVKADKTLTAGMLSVSCTCVEKCTCFQPIRCA